MAYSLKVAGYTFENPPEEYRKLARLGNSPQPSVDKEATDFYQSDTQDLQFQVEGTLALDPALGGTDDLAELERLQEIAIQGGEVEVQFDPFFSGKCVIEDDPFRQSESESSYSFTFTVNSETTDDTAYPSRSPPDTGNTFELGSLNIGYDPDDVSQNYERETESVKRLQGIARSVDNAGLVPRVKVSGMIDGEGQAELWQKARDNVLAFLSAEFQNGWCLIDSLSIRNNPEAPDYLEGLFQYDLDVLIVKDPESGIGDVTSYVDQTVKRTGTYAGDAGSGDSSFEDLEFTVDGGSGSLDGDYIEWNQTTVTLSNNDTNYVYVDDSDGDGYGTVKVNQSAFPADALALYRVEVSGGEIQKVVDVRAILLNDREREEGGDDGGETIAGDVYFTVFSGTYEIASGTTSEWNDTRLLLASSDRNYIWAEDDNTDGQAEVNTATSGYPTSGNYIEMYRVDTDADSVTDIIDDRPDDISDNTSDTSDADLNLNETLDLVDGDITFEQFLRFSDTLAVADANVDFTGLAELTDQMSVSDADLLFSGSTDFTDALAVQDGGSASAGTGSSTLQKTWETESDWDNNTSENQVQHPSGVVKLAQADIVYDFETGDTSRWDTVNTLVAQTGTVYAGTYSGESQSTNLNDPVYASVIPSELSGGSQISEFEFYWLETTDQRGSALRLENSSGSLEVGLATDNPQWDIDDGNGVETVYAGDGYDRWIRYRITFDWGAGTFSADFEDTQSGSTYTDSGRPLKVGQDIEKIVLNTYNGGGYTVSDDDLAYMWWDEIRVVP